VILKNREEREVAQDRTQRHN